MTVTDCQTNLVQAASEFRPELALVLGSGLGRLAERLTIDYSLHFHEVDGLAAASIESHAGRVSLAGWGRRRLLVFEGRLHFYEGHDWMRVERPIALAASLGVKQVILTNAAGGIRDDLLPGTLMVLRDHIEWTRPFAWREPKRPSPYSARLRDLLEKEARRQDIALASGVYAAVTGPTYETPAEIRALQYLGADAVGMSTAREAAKAVELGLECVAVSCITNRAAGLSTGPITHDEVVSNAGAQCTRLADLLDGFLGEA